MDSESIFRTIQNLFESHRGDAEWSVLIQRHLSDLFPNEESIVKIQSLNDVPLHHLRNLSLVRFRCFVQDMFDPEYYLGAYDVIDRQGDQSTKLLCGMYRDVTDANTQQEVDVDSENNVTLQRHLLYCISIPGENSWVKTNYAKRNPPGITHRQPNLSGTKRHLEDGSCGGDGDGSIPTDDVAMETDGVVGALPLANKRLKEHSGEAACRDGNNKPRTVTDLNTPIPDPSAVGCIVKIYDDTSATSGDLYKLNDEYEFVGIISLDPILSCSDNGDQFDSEPEAKELPASLVPRLHVLKAFKLGHNNPLLPAVNPAVGHPLSTDDSLCAEVRGHLHSVLEQLLWGDGLAADYLICHLLSTIYVRRDTTAIGKLSLNLCRIPEVEKSSFPVKLYELITDLVTKSHFLPLSIANLNQLEMTPKKDYSANRVRSGRLQLGAHTHLVLDETALEPGRLDTKGVHNVTALGNLLRWQKVEYDFSYHKMEFPTDVPVLVLAEGKSMLPTDFVVPIECSGQPQDLASRFAAVHQYLTLDVVRQIREYLTLNRLRDCAIPDELHQVIQEDFVAERQRDPSTKADTLHDWLVLARFLSLSYGHSSVSSATWEKVKLMERQRMARLTLR